MPEGDTIHYAANRIRPVLEGHVPDALSTPQRYGGFYTQDQVRDMTYN